MIHDIYDILSLVVLIMAIICTVFTFRLAKRHPSLRVVYGIMTLFCTYVDILYLFILFTAPDLGLSTAVLGRTGLILILSALIMFSIIVDK